MKTSPALDRRPTRDQSEVLTEIRDTLGNFSHIRERLGLLLISESQLAELLGRSTASVRRDDAADRIPRALFLGGSKRFRLAEIEEWVAAGCPLRDEWEARQTASRR